MNYVMNMNINNFNFNNNYMNIVEGNGGNGGNGGNVTSLSLLIDEASDIQVEKGKEIDNNYNKDEGGTDDVMKCADTNFATSVGDHISYRSGNIKKIDNNLSKITNTATHTPFQTCLWASSNVINNCNMSTTSQMKWATSSPTSFNSFQKDKNDLSSYSYCSPRNNFGQVQCDTFNDLGLTTIPSSSSYFRSPSPAVSTPSSPKLENIQNASNIYYPDHNNYDDDMLINCSNVLIEKDRNAIIETKTETPSKPKTVTAGNGKNLISSDIYNNSSLVLIEKLMQHINQNVNLVCMIVSKKIILVEKSKKSKPRLILSIWDGSGMDYANKFLVLPVYTKESDRHHVDIIPGPDNTSLKSMEGCGVLIDFCVWKECLIQKLDAMQEGTWIYCENVRPKIFNGVLEIQTIDDFSKITALDNCHSWVDYLLMKHEKQWLRKTVSQRKVNKPKLFLNTKRPRESTMFVESENDSIDSNLMETDKKTKLSTQSFEKSIGELLLMKPGNSFLYGDLCCMIVECKSLNFCDKPKLILKVWDGTGFTSCMDIVNLPFLCNSIPHALNVLQTSQEKQQYKGLGVFFSITVWNEDQILLLQKIPLGSWIFLRNIRIKSYEGEIEATLQDRSRISVLEFNDDKVQGKLKTHEKHWERMFATSFRDTAFIDHQEVDIDLTNEKNENMVDECDLLEQTMPEQSMMASRFTLSQHQDIELTPLKKILRNPIEGKYYRVTCRLLQYISCTNICCPFCVAVGAVGTSESPPDCGTKLHHDLATNKIAYVCRIGDGTDMVDVLLSSDELLNLMQSDVCSTSIPAVCEHFEKMFTYAVKENLLLDLTMKLFSKEKGEIIFFLCDTVIQSA